MKDQYFGDLNDYIKYSILNVLSKDDKINLAFVWLLTESDQSANGNNFEYLNNPDKWRVLNPELFDFLYDCIYVKKERKVTLIEDFINFRNCQFNFSILTDNLEQRNQYFNSLNLDKSNLIFLDPDNGLEVSSVKKGNKNSSKYIYLDEIENFYHDKKSIIFYQHFPRIERYKFINSIIEKIKLKLNKVDSTEKTTGYCFKTPNVAFFLIPEKSDSNVFNKQIEMMKTIYPKEIIEIISFEFG